MHFHEIHDLSPFLRLHQLFVEQERSGAASLRPLFYDFLDKPELPLGDIAWRRGNRTLSVRQAHGEPPSTSAPQASSPPRSASAKKA